MEREQKPGLAQKIDEMAQRLSVLPEWVQKIQPLDTSEFPDDMPIEHFLILNPPRSRRNDLVNALSKMGLDDEERLEEVLNTLSYLQEPTAGKYYYKICDHPLTIGELKTLSVEQLKMLNGFDKTTEPYKAGIVQKLFGLKS